ncbi:MAG: hypothetical protein KatS3mg038_1568 [Candidatus Kapaibacterium sp.]|nr:MAG: hypothetical protein KatS3mg038_1568 [Candidatus Kapabacteria bacterium]
MKTLLVISDEHQNSLSEMQEITSALRCDTLAGNIRKLDVLRAVRTGMYECLWFVGHGENNTFVLNASETLNAEEIAQLAQQCGAKHIMLNFCNSELMAYRIHYATGCDIVGVSSDVLTHEAMQLGALLAARIAEWGDFVKGFESLGRIQDYILLTRNESINSNEILLKIEEQEHEIKKIKLYIVLLLCMNLLSAAISLLS